MTLSDRHAAFHAFIELMYPEHTKTCKPNGCRCPQEVFYSAVRLARYTHNGRISQ